MVSIGSRKSDGKNSFWSVFIHLFTIFFFKSKLKGLLIEWDNPTIKVSIISVVGQVR
jgi:hypothetical protein